MKRSILLFALLAALVGCDTRGAVVGAENHPKRFQPLLVQDNERFEVWHDTETGQEIVCATGGGVQMNTSCWLTGRTWK